MTGRIPETYKWLIVPGQPDPRGNVEWTEIPLQGNDALATRAAKKLRNEELLLVQMGGTRLRHELDKVPLWRGDNVSVKQLAEDAARYLYLPRLRDEDVLLEAIHEGVGRLSWREDTFAYAEGWDAQRNRYKGLTAGKAVRALLDGQSVLVKPDVAFTQTEAERQQQEKPTDSSSEGASTKIGGGPSAGKPTSDGKTTVLPPAKVGRFHGSVKLDAMRLGRDAARIAEEVLQHLTLLVGSEVEVTLEIRAELPDGASDKLVRDVTENCRTLKFDSHGFEEV